MKPLFLTTDIGLELAEGDEVPRKFSGVLYSGGVVPGFNVIIDLESTRVDEPMSLLHEHSRTAVIGSITSAKIKRSQIAVDGELFSDIDPAAMEIATKAKRGARYQMSAGIFGFREEDVPAGSKIKVNGKTLTGPITVLRGGRIREGSVVTLGADPETAVSFFSQARNENDMDDNKRIEELEAAVTQLTAKLESETARANEAASQLLAQETARRTDAVKALFSQVGKEYSEQSASAYLGMSEESFTAAQADIIAMHAASKKTPNKALFSEQATEGSTAEELAMSELSPTNIYAKRAARA